VSAAEPLGTRARRLAAEHKVKVVKYLTGSILATVVSAVTYVATFGPALLGSRSASLASSATGAVCNYFLNRRWTWQRTGRADLRRELVPYWATVIATALVAAVVTGWVNGLVRAHTDSRGVRTAVNTLTFLAIYGVSFVVKYVVFDRLFSRPEPVVGPVDDDSASGSAGAPGSAGEPGGENEPRSLDRAST
jgi:putative flippase GtrA